MGFDKIIAWMGVAVILMITLTAFFLIYNNTVADMHEFYKTDKQMLDQYKTGFSIENATYNDSGSIWVYAKNTGKGDIALQNNRNDACIDVLIDNVWISKGNFSANVTNNAYDSLIWNPKEYLNIIVDQNLATGMHTLTIVECHGLKKNIQFQVTRAQMIYFVPPTEDNWATISRNWTHVNITIEAANIDTFRFNWNGTDYTFYDNSLILALNFNNNSAIGENATLAVDISKYSRNAICNPNTSSLNGNTCPAFNSSGRYGGAFTYDGIRKYFQTNFSSIANSGLTVEMWIKLANPLTITNNNTAEQCPIDLTSYRMCFGRNGRLDASITGNSTTWTSTGTLGANNFVWALAAWNGSYYGGTDNSGMVYRYDGGTTWTSIGQLGAVTAVWSLGVWNGSLYGGTNNGSFYRYDGGTTWAYTGSIGAGSFVRTLAVWNNSLYGGADGGIVYRYDGGTTWTSTGQLGAAPAVRILAIWNGSLYGGIGVSTGIVYRYDGGTTWTSAGTLGTNTYLNGLAVWNGSLYGGGDDTNIYRYDGGTTWTSIGGPNGMFSLVTWNGSLYRSSGLSRVYRYDGGTTWTQTQLPGVSNVLLLSMWNGTLYAVIGATVYSYGNGTSVSSQQNSWNTNFHHIALTSDGSTSKLYVDGSLSSTVSSTRLPPIKNPVIGKAWGGSGAGMNGLEFNGTIDELRVYNRALSAQEIWLQYQSEFQKYNSTEYRFYANITNLSPGTYTYYGWANDSAGSVGQTEVRTLAVDTVSPSISFTSPTAVNGSFINVNYSQVNISISEQNLNTFKFNWNGTNYSIYDDSLVLAMNFNNNSAIGENATNFVDVSKYGNNGTCSGATCPAYTTSGRYAGGVQFDGLDDQIDVPFTAGRIRNNITMEVWIKFSSLAGQQNYLSLYDSSSNRFVPYKTAGNYLRFWSNNWDSISSTNTVTANTWYHVASVYDGLREYLYVNGMLDASGIVPEFNLSDNPQTLYIGADRSSMYFNGTIDEVRIYNRSLSADEIQKTYQSEFSKYNSTQYRFYSNITNLTDGNYTYYGWANNTNGNARQTDAGYLRYLTVNSSFIQFIAPTLDNGSITTNTWVEANMTVGTPGVLDTLKYSWNGTNITFYNVSGPYTREIRINNTGEAITDYQVKLVFNSSTLDNATDFFSKATSANIRFYPQVFLSANLSSGVPYWVEYWNTTTKNATVWIKVPYVVANNNTPINMYYGGSGSSQSNGTDTFLFYEDFESGLGKWSRIYTDGSSAIESGELSETVTGTNAYKWEGYQSYSTFSTPYIFEWKENFILYTSPAGTPQSRVYYPAVPLKDYMYYYGNTWNFFYHNGTQYAYVVSGGWHSNRLVVNSTNIIYYMDGVSRVSSAGTSNYTGNVSFQAGQWTSGITTHLHYDNATARKFVLNEPIASVGSERDTASFYVRIENLSDGTYGYYGWMNTTSGESGQTDYGNPRYVTVSNSLNSVYFVAPTQNNATTISTNWTEANVTIITDSLDTFKFNWNGTNYTFYNDSLVLAMNLNNNSAIGESDTKAVDISQYGNNGSCTLGVNCPTWTTSGKYQGASSFDGSSKLWDCGNAASVDMTSNDFTVEVWAKSNGYVSASAIIAKGAYFEMANTGYFLSYSVNPQCIYGGIYTGSVRYIINTGMCDAFDWTHFAMVRNGSNMYMYLNGTKMGEVAVAGSITTADHLYLGYTSSQAAYFNGIIDEVRIYQRALSGQEVLLHYQSELQKYDSSSYRFYANVTNLSSGTYTYYAWANNTAGTIGQTDNGNLRYLIVSGPDTTAPIIENASLNRTSINMNEYVELNVTVFDARSSVDSVKATFQYPNSAKVNKTLTKMYSQQTDNSGDVEAGTIQNVGGISSYTYYSNGTESYLGSSGLSEYEGTSLTWIAESGSRYLVMGYMEANCSMSGDIYIRVRRDGAAQFHYVDRIAVAATERAPFSFMQIYDGTGSSVKYNWTFASSGTGSPGRLRARLYAIRIDSLTGAQNNCTFNGSLVSGVDTVFGNAGGDTDQVNITPATGGLYMIWGSAAVRSNNLATSASMRMNLDNGAEYIPYLAGAEATYSYARLEDLALTEFTDFSVFAVRWLNPSTHNIKMQLADDTGSNAGWRNRTVIVMRISDSFADYYNASTTTQTSTISTTFQNLTSISVSGDSGSYLALGGITWRGDTASYDFENQLALDNTGTNLEAVRPNYAYDYLPRAFMHNFSLNSGTHTIATQYRRQDASGTLYVKNSDLLLLNLNPVQNTESSNTPVTYNDVAATAYAEISSIKVIVNVTLYNNSGSVANSNNNPDINVEIYNGSSWINVGSLGISGSGNYSKATNEFTVMSSWAASSLNRDIRLSGIYLDYNSASKYDSINYTDVWVEVSSANTSAPLGNWYHYIWTDTSNIGRYSVTNIIANDTAGNVNNTAYSNLNFDVSESTLAISFVSPTQSNATTISMNWTEANVTISTGSIDTFKYNWNGADYTFYDSSLVLALNYNNNSAIGENSTYAADISEYGNNATCSAGNCPNWTGSGRFAGAYRFYGIDDFFDAGNSSSLSLGQYTASLWAKNSSALSAESMLLTKGMGDINYRIFVLPNGTIAFTVRNASINLTRVGNLTLASGEEYLESAIIDPLGQYAYFGVWAAPSKIIKVNLSSFTKVGTLTLGSDDNYTLTATIDPAGGYAYFGTQTSPARVVKINLSSFTKVSTIVFNSGEDYAFSSAMDPQGRYIYYGTDTNPSRIVKVDLASFTRVGNLTLNTNENSAYSSVIDPAGRYGYFSTSTVPGRIVKVDLASFTRVGNVTLATNENYVYSSIIDPAGRYAYLGTQTSPAKVVKIDLASFTRVNNITFASGENNAISAAIDPSGQYAYFGVDTSPGRVVKIDLTNFSRAANITLSSGENSLYSAAVDPSGQYAYFGTQTSPARIVKVSLRNNYTTDSTYSTTKISNTFAYITAVKNSTHMSLFVNGNMESTKALTSSAPTVPDSLMIGGAPRTAGDGHGLSWLFSSFNGTIDEVRIYNRSLSSQEILMHYQSDFQRYNSTEYRFYANVTNLSSGTYTYYAWANNTAGTSGMTDSGYPRYISVNTFIYFMPPTQANGTSLSRNWTEANITVNTGDVDTFKFNWNGTTYTFYDNSLVLALNFNNNSAIGESSTKAVDISRYANNGTLYNSSWSQSGVFRGSVSAGIEGFVNVSDSASLRVSGGVSLLIWMNLSANKAFLGIGPGDSHVCGVLVNGSVMCWGDGQYYAMGDGSATNNTFPNPVSGDYNFSEVSSGSMHTCGILVNRSAMCWGTGGNNQLGNGVGSSRVPVFVSGNYNYSSISAGNIHNCGILVNGSVMCWGDGQNYRLGDGSTTANVVPGLITGTYNFSMISAGDAHTCGVLKNGSAMCWGYGSQYRLGDGATTDNTVPGYVSGNYNFSMVSAGDAHTCGVLKNGSAMCWGYGSQYQLGDGATTDNTVPGYVSGNYNFSMVSAGNMFTCGVLVNGSAMCWGWGSNYQLGDGSTTSNTVPGYVSGNYNFSSVFASFGMYSCGVLVDGGVMCWGTGGDYYMPNYQLGDGSMTNNTVPGFVVSGVILGKSHQSYVLYSGFGSVVGSVNNNSVWWPVSGGWHHVAITYDGAGNLTFFADGQRVYNRSYLSGSVDSEYADVHIGIKGGLYDEAMIYNRTLSTQEVWIHYKSELQKYNSNEWRFYVNVTNLTTGTYSYYGWANNSAARSGQTDFGNRYYTYA